MAYSNLDDLKLSLPATQIAQLTDDSVGAVIDTNVVDRAIADADAFIDLCCGARYSTPMGGTHLLRSWSVILAVYNLYQRRKGAPKERLQDRENVIKTLLEIKEGKLSLADIDAIARIETSGDLEDRIFTIGKKSLGEEGEGTLDPW